MQAVGVERDFRSAKKMRTTVRLCVVALCALLGVIAQDDIKDEGGKFETAVMGRALGLRGIVGGFDEDSIEAQRIERSPEVEDNEEDDSPDARHLHKIKRKRKPHKFGHHHHHYNGLGGGNLYPAFGAYPGVGCRTFGCGGHGWHKPQYGGGGPFAGAFAGPSYGNGWNGGWGGGRPGWNPLQEAFGFGR